MRGKNKATGKLRLFAVTVFMLVFATCLISCNKEKGDSMEVTKFTFAHNGMSRYDCYEFTVEKTTEGALLTIEPYAGAKVGKAQMSVDILDILTEIARSHELKAWDGYDRTGKKVFDGNGFYLKIEFGDGKVINARGTNLYPEGYAEAFPVIRNLFFKLGEYWPGWVGEYAFQQVDGQMFFDYKLIIEEVVGPETKEVGSIGQAVDVEGLFTKNYTGVLTGDGFQTMDRMKVRLEDDGGMVAVVLDEYLPDNMYESFKPGDVLFRLKPEGETIYTKWEKMTPNLPLAGGAKPEAWSVCWEQNL